MFSLRACKHQTLKQGEVRARLHDWIGRPSRVHEKHHTKDVASWRHLLAKNPKIPRVTKSTKEIRAINFLTWWNSRSSSSPLTLKESTWGCSMDGDLEDLSFWCSWGERVCLLGFELGQDTRWRWVLKHNRYALQVSDAELPWNHRKFRDPESSAQGLVQPPANTNEFQRHHQVGGRVEVPAGRDYIGTSGPGNFQAHQLAKLLLSLWPLGRLYMQKKCLCIWNWFTHYLLVWTPSL